MLDPVVQISMELIHRVDHEFQFFSTSSQRRPVVNTNKFKLQNASQIGSSTTKSVITVVHGSDIVTSVLVHIGRELRFSPSNLALANVQ